MTDAEVFTAKAAEFVRTARAAAEAGDHSGAYANAVHAGICAPDALRATRGDTGRDGRHDQAPRPAPPPRLHEPLTAPHTTVTGQVQSRIPAHVNDSRTGEPGRRPSHRTVQRSTPSRSRRRRPSRRHPIHQLQGLNSAAPFSLRICLTRSRRATTSPPSSVCRTILWSRRPSRLHASSEILARLAYMHLACAQSASGIFSEAAADGAYPRRRVGVFEGRGVVGASGGGGGCRAEPARQGRVGLVPVPRRPGAVPCRVASEELVALS